LRERAYLENTEVDGRIILRWLLSKWDEEAWSGLVWLGTRTSAGVSECANEASGSIKFGKFLYQLKSC
jgi:hypothetical protein